jgi:formate hydrogenlyase subunit 3/multisubunit Na+/H+ antiporter MnhD subunit
VVGGLALVATPLGGIFLSEAYTLLGLLRDASSWEASWQLAVVALAFVVSSILVFAGLVRHLGRIVLGVPGNPGMSGFSGEAHPDPYERSYTPMLIALFILVVVSGFFVFPGVGDIVNAAVNILQRVHE